MEFVAILILLVAILAVLLLSRGAKSKLEDGQVSELAESVRSELASAQLQALQQNSSQFLDLAETRLKAEAARGEEQVKARASEIDKSMESMATAITRLRDYVESVDKVRGESVASLSSVTASLGTATGKLTNILSSGPARGQWGERMAEDVLRVAGFAEGVQYRKNTHIEGGTGRPDFTFLLPQHCVLHMDVKFPLAGYVRFIDAPSDLEKDLALTAFLRDARSRVKEVTGRDYIDPAGGTLDYVLLFIPNEQIYEFIQERDSNFIDQALQQRVVVCSPFTLFAVLAIIRQAIDNFHLTQQTDEILRTLGGFTQQWSKYKGAMTTVERRLDRTQRAFEDLVGTRTRTLDRQLERVERLRRDAGLEAAMVDPSEDVSLLVDESSDSQVEASSDGGVRQS